MSPLPSVEVHDVQLRTISHCEVCGSPDLLPVLDLGLHAMCDDLVAIGDARECLRFPIAIVFCATCCTAHQKHQVPQQALFPRSYHYRSSLTADVLRGMAQLVDSIEQHDGPVSGERILDIGCNDGSLLSIFKARGAITHGIDPTDAALEAAAAGHSVTQGFFDVASARAFVAEFGHPDVITFTNVFAHIEQLQDLLSALRVLLGPASRLVIENHYLGAVTARLQFDTFYHEHPRTYSYASFGHIAAALDRTIHRVEFPSRYGGNVRVVIGVATAASPATADRPDESALGAELRAMPARVERWRQSMRQHIEQLVLSHGPLRAKAFPGRAAIIVELLQLDTSLVSAVYEQPASPKIGHYLPGTRIPIVSDADFDTRDASPVINFAWHIQGEIEGYLRRAGFAGVIVPVVSLEHH